jgi:hypothetical protein
VAFLSKRGQEAFADRPGGQNRQGGVTGPRNADLDAAQKQGAERDRGGFQGV